MTYPAGLTGGGTPLGFGSPFHVVRAVCRGGQIVRVVFSAEPKHKSASALDDGLTPANYLVSVASGSAQTPRTVGVLPTLVEYPAFGVFLAGEFALDVQVDRPLVVGLAYTITAQPALRAADMTLVGYPFTAAFAGAARPVRSRHQRSKETLLDFASSPFGPGPLIDESGDWATQDGLDGTKKRCMRRILTAKSSFAHLPGYGLEIDVKAPMTTARLTQMRTDIGQQVKQEPDVVAANTSVEMNALGYLRLDLKVKTADNQEVGLVMQASEQGATIT